MRRAVPPPFRSPRFVSPPPRLEQLLSPVALLPGGGPDPCAKETVLNAIKESRKRVVEEEEDEEEQQALGSDQESKRRYRAGSAARVKRARRFSVDRC